MKNSIACRILPRYLNFDRNASLKIVHVHKEKKKEVIKRTTKIV